MLLECIKVCLFRVAMILVLICWSGMVDGFKLTIAQSPSFGELKPSGSGSGLGYAVINGSEPGIWDVASVIYARVDGIERQQGSTYVVHLIPLATLTGRLDAAATEEVSPQVQVSEVSDRTMIRHVPEKGAKVLVYLGNNFRNPPRIPDGPVIFLPEYRGLAEVTGFDDPKVAETIENLRKLRGKQREEAEKAKADPEKAKPAPQPAAAQSPAGK